VPARDRVRGVARVLATIATVLLVPPFIALAVLPMLLVLVPVALICIPFIVPAMLSGSLAARDEDVKRASWRPEPHPAARARARLRTVN
ncbi:MAG TPA: hypothetical protein VJR89_42115, partial [Polyangiales bacterium]|nr:hypothetical protein [Polyangiales bacterium]